MTSTLTTAQIADLMTYAANFAAQGLPVAHYRRMVRLCRIAEIEIDDAIAAAI
jgi:hypothetical protein